jgi:hypothetical protein
MTALSYLDQFALVTERYDNRPMECVLITARGKGRYPIEQLEEIFREKLVKNQVCLPMKTTNQ